MMNNTMSLHQLSNTNIIITYIVSDIVILYCNISTFRINSVSVKYYILSGEFVYYRRKFIMTQPINQPVLLSLQLLHIVKLYPSYDNSCVRNVYIYQK